MFFGVLAVELNIELSPTKYEKEVIEGAKSLLYQNLKNDLNFTKLCARKSLKLLILAVLGKKEEKGKEVFSLP